MLKKRKSKKLITKQEFLTLLKSHSEEFLRDKYLFLLPLVQFIDFYLLILFLFPNTFNIYLLITLICNFFLLLKIINYFEYNAVEKLYNNDQKKAYEIAKNLVTFIETKSKKRTDDVKKIFNKIKKYKLVSEKLNKFFQINIGLFFILLMFSFIYTIEIFFLPSSNSTAQDITSILIIKTGLFLYFSILFSIRSKQYFNMDGIIKLLALAFQKDLLACINNIKQILNTKFESIEFTLFTENLDNWYSYYIGNYFDKTELNNILFDLHDYYVPLKMEEVFYEVLMDVRVKLINDLVSYDKSKNENIFTKSQFAAEKIDNYLNLLDFKIKKKTEKWNIRNRKTYFIYITVSILVSTITLALTLITIFS